MRLYIYEDVDRITDRYHNSGGVVIITDRDPAQVWREHVDKELADMADWERDAGLNIDREAIVAAEPRLTALVKADAVDGAQAVKEQVFVFPDAGCC